MTLSPPPQQSGQGFSDKVLGVLRDPSRLPPEFAAWVRGQIVRNPTVKLDLFQLPSTDKKHLIGAAGEPAFQNAWVNFVSTYELACFFKDLSGLVHLQGLIKSGTINTVAFTLPISYRPTADHIFGTSSNNLFGGVVVRQNGDVVPNIGSNVWISLSGISFRP